ncbi:GTP 3',8-cyclase MoaA [Pontibacter sp. G13]|uniref:GTP 3',8-cyclase MoaA n=1 Tax=Pontibacter sp. G13 TaxID=3074898 RepID=UPI00288A69C2|nr:GTP 3',8-cyclase MoaA [Pontibacter sp. G13]WNJ17178.1 GTP 3',8-cyclase MoaA [Pontibacter sp. G13]
MPTQLLDNHGRPLDYVRIAVTDRCNLRCTYCMPAEGIQYVPRQQLLTFEEILRLVQILAKMGVKKVRLTGGEPFLRKDFMKLLEALAQMEGIEHIHLTTNGILTTPHIPALKELGISGVNLSLDTLDRERFKTLTRRDELEKVLLCLDELVSSGIPTKLNAVIMAGQNTQDVVPLARLAEEMPIAVRFIEEMPFNGQGFTPEQKPWTHRQIQTALEEAFPGLEQIPAGPNSTSRIFAAPALTGKLGIIPAFSRTFCGSCNRIRITAKGLLKTCLYDDGVLDLRALVRSDASDQDLEAAFLKAFGNRAKDGFEAEKRRNDSQSVSESMSTIGG